MCTECSTRSTNSLCITTNSCTIVTCCFSFNTDCNCIIVISFYFLTNCDHTRCTFSFTICLSAITNCKSKNIIYLACCSVYSIVTTCNCLDVFTGVARYTTDSNCFSCTSNYFCTDTNAVFTSSSIFTTNSNVTITICSIFITCCKSTRTINCIFTTKCTSLCSSYCNCIRRTNCCCIISLCFVINTKSYRRSTCRFTQTTYSNSITLSCFCIFTYCNRVIT